MKTIEEKVRGERLYHVISNESGIKLSVVKKVMQSIASYIWTALEEGTEIDWPNLGKFDAHARKDMISNCVRTGKNGVANASESTEQKIYNPACRNIHFSPSRLKKREFYKNTLVLPETLPEGTVLSRDLFDTIRIRYGEEVALSYPYSSDQIVELEDGTHFMSSGYEPRDNYKLKLFHY